MESGLTLTVHGLTLGGILAILGLMFHQHKIWVRMKDWVNELRREYCERHDIPFTPLDNGH